MSVLVKLRFRLYRSSYRKAVSTLHYALENGADLRVRRYDNITLGLLKKEEELEEEKRMPNRYFLIRTVRT